MGSVGAFSVEEVEKVRQRYPRLLHAAPAEVTGFLDLYAVHEGLEIKDVFEVHLLAPSGYPDAIPQLYEIGGRTDAIARGWGITNPLALHRFPETNRACVGTPQAAWRKFPPGSDLFTFVEELAVPYLYGLSHFDRAGRWPWGDTSHGAMGILEFYADGDTTSTREELLAIGRMIRSCPNWVSISKQLRRPSAERRCPCGSKRGRPFAACHERAWAGTLVLAEERRRAGLRHIG